MSLYNGPILPEMPTLPWRLASSVVMGAVGLVCKGYLYGLNRVHVTGMENLLETLEERRTTGTSKRGLVTISNHVSVVDDPLIWGVLPLKHIINPTVMRWSLGAHDICFQTPNSSTFFALGQVMPCHRFRYSPSGGVYQPTMQQALTMISTSTLPHSAFAANPAALPNSPLTPTFTTNGKDLHRSPAYYSRNRGIWLHIFPEGCITQYPMTVMRYFKWGVARFILEAEPTPDVIPMFINGTQDIMPEDRDPRWLPKWGVDVRIAFGKPLNTDAVFGDLITKWKTLEAKHQSGKMKGDLQTSTEAMQIRLQTVERMWEEVNKVKTSLGYPETPQDQKLATTFAGEVRDNTL